MAWNPKDNDEGIITMEIDEFIEVLEEMPSRFKKDAQRIVKTTSEQMVRDMSATVPVDTGHLRRTIGYKLKDNGMSSRVGANMNGNTDYGSYVEYGTRYMRAQPYFRPAFDKAEEEFKRKVKGLK